MRARQRLDRGVHPRPAHQRGPEHLFRRDLTQIRDCNDRALME